MKALLITGITGLIGKAVLRKILSSIPDYSVTALVRPNTALSRFQEFANQIEIVPLDLTDTSGIRDFLKTREFETILHIGALRGGRKFSHTDYYKANVHSTEQFIEYCLPRGSRLLFCSSVGVYGAIPEELPANSETQFNGDNYYHYTKIQAEKMLNQQALRGLKMATLRPSIVYGKGDYGFPWQLVKMIDHYRFPLINKRIWIHLCNIETISDAFLWLLTHDYPNALTLNIADRESVQLKDLVNFISRQLRKKNYPPILSFDRKVFALGELISQKLKNELWTSRFQLISKSWIYDVRDAYELMGLPQRFTIPDIQVTIKDYLEGKK